MREIRILAFRGLEESFPDYEHYPQLLKAGHVGIQFEDNDVIFGFHPTSEAVEAVGGEKIAADMLWSNERLEGALQDDTRIFDHAHKLATEYGANTTVYVLIRQVSDEDFQTISDTAANWYNNSKVFWYNFPYRDGSFNDGEHNCAVFPKLLGIEIPIDNGRLSKYLPAMKEEGAVEWHP